MVRRVLTAAGALLALFHVWLFAGQILDGALADPALVLRWLSAGVLVAALRALHRRGHSIVRGRRAVAIWLLAALLHAPAAAGRTETDVVAGLPEIASVLSAIAVVSTVTLAALIFAGGLFGRRAPGSHGAERRTRPTAVTHVSASVALLTAPRPPPLTA
jgi:hypothetical protein